MTLRTRSAALLAIPSLALGLAACAGGDDAGPTPAPEPGTVAGTAEPAASGTADARGAAADDAAPAIVRIGGRDVDGEFAPVRCTVDGDDLDVEAGEDKDRGRLTMEIEDHRGARHLDDLDIDTADLHVEVDDEDADAATVTSDGDVWTIEGQGRHDHGDGSVEPVHVQVTCPAG